jgi:CRISPR type III-associated protein (TIGR04423 family)
VDLINSVNPFIIEGQLSDGKTSISIKYVDGNYIVKKYALSDMEDIEKKEIYYLPNRMKELDNKSLKLCFNQYWRPKADKYCAGNIDNPDSVDNGMQVLQPAELVFVGFKIKED